MHAIATTVNDFRERPGEPGLVWGNGGYLTKHSLGVYSTQPPDSGFRHDDVQVAVDALPAACWPSRPTPPGQRRSRRTR